MKAKRFHVTTILVAAGLLFAAACLSWATLSSVSGDKLVVTGTEVGANVTITETAGSADIDISSATIPRNYKGHKLQITDPYGKSAYGYVYTDGAGTVQNIVSAKGGTTRNWSAIETGFNATATGTFPYRIYKDSRLVQVATGSVTQANTRLDMTATNAFAWLNGVDLSAYQTGKYYLCLYNATGGYGACGWISSVAPAGETLSGELATGWTNGASPNDMETLTSSGLDVSSGINTTGVGLFYLNTNMGADNKLIKYTFDITLNSGTMPEFKSGGVDLASNTLKVPTAGLNSGYYSIATFLYGFKSASAFDIALASFSFKQVTDPPSTAVKIVSSDLSTRAWPWKHASFNANDSAGITYKVYYAGD